MREAGFQGPFILEFTEGTKTRDENMEMLYRNALLDMEFLRDNWK